MKYTKDVEINKELLEKAREFIKVDDLSCVPEEELTQKGMKEDDNFPLFKATFDNGVTVCCDISSGSTNYYDDMWIEYPTGRNTVLDCNYELPDEIEVVDKNDVLYVIHLIEK